MTASMSSADAGVPLASIRATMDAHSASVCPAAVTRMRAPPDDLVHITTRDPVLTVFEKHRDALPR